jgi:hypothetical protein
MANNQIQRPTTVIKKLIVPISSEKKVQVASAIQEFVNRIKAKHL